MLTNPELALQFFMQLAIILVACRLVGVIAAWLGQPQVVAEMIAGVFLGPSLFGLWLPEWQQWLFPWDTTQSTRDSQSYLYPVSQLGLALYMFVVGMEFRIDVVRQSMRRAFFISAAGMLVPFVLGAALAWVLVEQTDMFMPKTSRFEAMLFLGASLCITAFPMLARIIHTKGLTGTEMGTVAIGAGAIDDAAAWCFLAIVLASFDGDPAAAVWSIGGGAAFVGFAVVGLRPMLRWLQSYWRDDDGGLSETGTVTALVIMTMGAWTTEWLQLHAVFGAFVVGAMMPRGFVTRDLVGRVQPLTVAVLLPLFFTYSGLNTKITVLDSPQRWIICGTVLLVAVLGKGVACAIAAMATGMSRRDAIGIGTLMNSRGLMELIVINIGLQRGVISEALFASLVLMAIATTLMASPVFDRLFRHAHHE